MLQIENFRKQSNGTIVALFDVYMPKLSVRFRNLKVINGKKGHFVGFPSFAVEENGNKRYVPYIEFSKEKQDEFVRLVKEALAPYLRGEQIPEPGVPGMPSPDWGTPF